MWFEQQNSASGSKWHLRFGSKTGRERPTWQLFCFGLQRHSAFRKTLSYSTGAPCRHWPLFNFYPSLRVAKVLASDSLFRPTVSAFIDGLKLPRDISHLVYRALHLDFHENESDPNEMPWHLPEFTPQTDVRQALDDVANADAVMQGSAMDTMRQLVSHNPDSVGEALWALYKRDLETVAPLAEVDATDPVSPSAFVDERTMLARLGSPSSPPGSDSYSEDRQLANQLRQLRAQIELNQATAEPTDFVTAALEMGSAWLSEQPTSSPSFDTFVLGHLEAWAFNR
jgi:hypothetical protein